MKKRLALIFKALLALLIFMVVYRLARKVSRPEVMFDVAHYLHIGFLVFCTALVAWEGRRYQAAIGLTPDRVETTLLAGVTFFVVIGFVMVAWARVTGNKPDAMAIRWFQNAGNLEQALWAGALFAVPVWLVHIFLKGAAPGRDPILFPVACMLGGVGLIFLFRLGPDMVPVRGSKGFYFLFWNQVRSIIISFLVLLIAIKYFSRSRLDSLTRKRYIWVLLSVVLIVLTAVFGTEINGRKLSLNLGVMNFQTVELVKLMALLFMAGYFRYEMHFLEAGRGRFGLPRTRYLLPYLAMWFLVLLPIFLQKDLGPTALIFALFLAVFYLGTGSFFSVLAGVSLMATAGIAAYFLEYPSMVKTRVDMWLDPFHYSQNVAEGLWALCEGGWFGVGSGRGLGYYIPVVQSDFNFVVIAEEWGFAGAVGVLACFGILAMRSFSLARDMVDEYRQLFIAGLGTLWLIQTLIIVGGNIGALPLTGITLPFISYGGSSLVVNFLALGIVLRASVPVEAAAV